MKERRSVVAAGKEVETRTWWLLLAVVLGSVGVLRGAGGSPRARGDHHESLDAELGGRSGRHLVCIRGALFVGSGLSPRERLAAAPAALLGYSPRTKAGPGATNSYRGRLLGEG
jgi:hypothetical protein